MLAMLAAAWALLAFQGKELITSYAAHFPTTISAALTNPDGSGVLQFLLMFGAANLVFWGLWWPSAMDQWHRCAASGQAATALDRKIGTQGSM